MKKIINSRTIVIALMILFAGAWRLLLTIPAMVALSNFTPVGAMALFSGCYFKNIWKAFLAPLITLWISDVILDSFIYGHTWTLFYVGWEWVYTAFAIMVVIGMLIKKVNIKNIIIAGIIATLAHWIITDFGLWLGGGLDITTGKPFLGNLAGLIKSLYLALPFEKNMLLGNLVFGGVLFGIFEWAQRKFPMLRIYPQPSIKANN